MFKRTPPDKKEMRSGHVCERSNQILVSLPRDEARNGNDNRRVFRDSELLPNVLRVSRMRFLEDPLAINAAIDGKVPSARLPFLAGELSGRDAGVRSLDPARCREPRSRERKRERIRDAHG